MDVNPQNGVTTDLIRRATAIVSMLHFGVPRDQWSFSRHDEARAVLRDAFEHEAINEVELSHVYAAALTELRIQERFPYVSS